MQSNQGFVYNKSIIGVQFHPEYNDESIRSTIEQYSENPENEPSIMPSRQIEKESARFLCPANDVLARLLDNLIDVRYPEYATN